MALLRHLLLLSIVLCAVISANSAPAPVRIWIFGPKTPEEIKVQARKQELKKEFVSSIIQWALYFAVS